MSETKFVMGIDFGTESGRVALIELANGQEIASSVTTYPNGVIDEKLPATDIVLEPDWALQDPNDYLFVLQQAVPAVLTKSGVDPTQVIGLGVDFTSSTILPTFSDGTPLCFLPEWRANPHVWVKLWKHHAAQPEANKMTEIAYAGGYSFLDRYGGKISSEWFFPKV
jgi:L-ribulokinase